MDSSLLCLRTVFFWHPRRMGLRRRSECRLLVSIVVSLLGLLLLPPKLQMYTRQRREPPSCLISVGAQGALMSEEKRVHIFF